jgi:hypothetical protein
MNEQSLQAARHAQGQTRAAFLPLSDTLPLDLYTHMHRHEKKQETKRPTDRHKDRQTKHMHPAALGFVTFLNHQGAVSLSVMEPWWCLVDYSAVDWCSGLPCRCEPPWAAIGGPSL